MLSSKGQACAAPTDGNLGLAREERWEQLAALEPVGGLGAGDARPEEHARDDDDGGENHANHDAGVDRSSCARA